jgi:hypothetical protein
MADAEQYEPYGDSREPRVFSNASSFDPELFLSMNECADELLSGQAAGKRSGKYSPLDVAEWIEDCAAAGRAALAQAEGTASNRGSAEYRCAKLDIEIQAGLGEFFGAKFRSGVLFHLYESSKERAALDATIVQYKKARAAWAKLANAASGVYMTDITAGEQPFLRGHWTDRLPRIDKDIASLSTMLGGAATGQISPAVKAAMQAVADRSRRPSIAVKHAVPARFVHGEELPLAIAAPADITAVWLHYRHVDQAENYISMPMERQSSRYVSSIPAAYTQTMFPLEYFFQISMSDGQTWLHPGFQPELTNQPYFVVRSA